MNTLAECIYFVLTYFWQHKGYIYVLLDGNSKTCRMNEIRYRSLAKERPLPKERPSPTFGPISCIGSKFTRMSAHHGASFAWSLKSTASSAMRISGKKLRVVLHHNYRIAGTFRWCKFSHKLEISLRIKSRSLIFEIPLSAPR